MDEIGMLRHAVATLAYRGAKVLRGAPAGFEKVRAGEGTRSAGEIVSHLSDLLDWAYLAADGRPGYRVSEVLGWKENVLRFFAAMKTFDDRLASGAAVEAPVEKLLQGPVADALGHVGQLATLRRLAGAGVRGESYFRADIVAGRVGMEQTAAAVEFD